PSTPGAMKSSAVVGGSRIKLPPAEVLPQAVRSLTASVPLKVPRRRRVTRSTTPYEPPRPKYKYITEYEVEYVPKVYYDVGFFGGGRPILVRRIRFEKRVVPVRRKVPIDY
ncbi:MAG: hypothetical protein N2C14_01970, partial [Planctomycetales bacterium]